MGPNATLPWTPYSFKQILLSSTSSLDIIDAVTAYRKALTGLQKATGNSRNTRPWGLFRVAGDLTGENASRKHNLTL